VSVAGAIPAFDSKQAWQLVRGSVPACPIGTLVTLSIRGSLLDVTRPWVGLLASVDLRTTTLTLSPDGSQCLIRAGTGEALFAKVATSGAPGPLAGTLPIELGESNPQGYLDGRWTSSGYRSGRTRARWLQVFFVLEVVSGFWLLLQAVQMAGIAVRAAAGTLPTRTALDALIASERSALSLFSFSTITLAIAFFVWLSRSVDVVPALAGGTPRESPRSSVGWWFVPIVDFWKPYSILRELWDRLSVPSLPAGGLVVGGWWLTLIGAFLVDKVAAIIVSGVPSPAPWSTLQVVDLLEVGVFASYLVAATLGLLMVREIQGRADFRAHALGYGARPAMAPGMVSPTWAPVAPAADSQPVAAAGPAAVAAPAAVAEPAAGPGPSAREALQTLTELHDQGLVTDDEYAAKRSEILARL